jgi:AmmeMemoRadiSam system protein B
MGAIHQTPYAGSWFPALPAHLNALLAECFRQSGKRAAALPAGRAVGFIAPHAGMRYSGVVAAAVYRCLAAAPPPRAVVLYFNHNGPAAGIGCPSLEAYATPLGLTRVDGAELARLAGSAPFRSLPEPTLCDHSLEVQLPYLETACPHCLLIPLCVGLLSPEDRRAAAGRIAPLAGRGAVFIASTDFTHYGRAFGYTPFPPGGDVRQRIADLDTRLMESMASLDPEAFLAAHRELRSTLCGTAPVALLLETLRLVEPPLRLEILDYQTSGDLTGDFNHCVAYAALAFSRPADGAPDGGIS